MMGSPTLAATLSPTTQILLAGVVFLLAHMLSTVTGFGAGILGLPLLTLLVGMTPAKQSLVVLSMFLYTYMVLRWRAKINRRELARIIVIALPGLFVGIAAYRFLPPRLSIVLLAGFVMAVGVRGLINFAPRFVTPPWLRRVMLFMGGIVHGAFTTGGPLMVVYCRSAIPEKSAFRATVAAIWLTLGFTLCCEWTASHAWDPNTGKLILIGIPFLLIGLGVGEILHHRASERVFGKAVNATLVGMGMVLMYAAGR